MIPSEYMTRLQPFMDPPTDVQGAANELGLAIYSASLPSGISGILKKDSEFGTPSGFVIFVNSNEPKVRQRFSAAHEIGHFVHHRNLIGDKIEEDYLLRAEGLSNWQETEANKFAADLLMPRNKISEAVERGTTSVEALAREFNVSKLAMGIRLGLPT